MKQEFGSSSNTLLSPNSIYNDDTSSQRSDCTSITSWGRNLLMERNTGDCLFAVVRPADSLSTKAMPLMKFDIKTKNNEPDFSQDLIQTSCLSFNSEKIENNNSSKLEINTNSTSAFKTHKEITNEAKKEVSLKMSPFYRKQVNLLFFNFNLI